MKIESREEVSIIRERGFEPLMMVDTFIIEPVLRRELVLELFPKYSPAMNNKFYRWYWDNYPGERLCEETGRLLINYWSGHVSHILPRGGYPQFAYDPLNINLLSYEAHNKWGDPSKRKTMQIWPKNEKRIEIMREMEREWPSYLRRDI